MSESASPISTGGGGTTFEMKVQAAFVVSLLTQGPCPCLPTNEKISSIHLQNAHLGYTTDDLLAVVEFNGKVKYRFIAQIKSTVKLAKSNEDFVEAIKSFWKDFTNEKIFNKSTDKFALITSYAFASYYSEISPILNLAKFSRDGGEFKTKFDAIASVTKKEYLSRITSILNEAKGSNLTDDEIWGFCRCFEVLLYDFNVTNGNSEAGQIAILELGKRSGVSQEANSLWSDLITYIQEVNRSAGTITLTLIPEQIRSFFNNDFQLINNDSIRRLISHSQTVFDIVRDKIGGRVKIDRSHEVNTAISLLGNKFVVMAGNPGIGKSAIAKELSERLRSKCPVFGFKATEFNANHIDEILAGIGLNDSIATLFARFSILGEKILFIESLEKVFELESKDALRQLFAWVSKDESWRVIATCRPHALDQVIGEIFLPLNIQPAICEIPLLNEQQINFIKEQLPEIAPYFDNENLRDLLRIPFFIEILTHISVSSSTDISNLDIFALKAKIWEQVIEKVDEQRGGLNIKRRKCFIDIAVKRAKTMNFTVPLGEFDAEALEKLILDEVIVRIGGGVAPSHDVFEDWALIQFVDDQFNLLSHEPDKFFGAVGTEPAMRRSLRLWILEKLKSEDRQSLINFISSVFQAATTEQYWRDEIITALLLSEDAHFFFNNQKKSLLINDAALLKRVMHLLRVTCKGPDDTFFGLSLPRQQRLLLHQFFLKPKGSGWLAAIRFIHDNMAQIDIQHVKIIRGVLKDWCRIRKPNESSFEGARETGLIALNFWNLLRDKHAHDIHEDLLKIALDVAESIKDELTILIDEALKFPVDSRPRELKEFLNIICSSIDCAWICKALPDKVIQVAEVIWLTPKFKSKNRAFYEGSSVGVDGYFGLSRAYHHEFFPASALQGPFPFLLNHHPDKAISFIVKLVNHTTDCYQKSGLDESGVEKVLLTLNEGVVVEVIGSDRLWSCYRATHVAPEVLESALMALEEWFFKSIEQHKDVSANFNYILRESRSCALLGVLTSIALAHYRILQENCLPLLRTKDFFHWDMIRQHRDMSHIPDIRGLIGAPKGGVDDIHYKTLTEAQKRSHRKYNLEYLALNLQVSNQSLREKVQAIIDDYHNELPTIEKQDDNDRVWRIALKRMDLREYSIEETKDFILFNPKDVAPDIKEFQDKSAPAHTIFLRYIALYGWANKRFENSKEGAIALTWQEALKEAKELFERNANKEEKPDGDLLSHFGGPIITAAVCLRDEFDNLSKEDRAWCLKVLLMSLRQDMDNLSHDMHYSKTASLDGTGAAAAVLPFLIGKFDKRINKQIKQALAGAITHMNEEVAQYAAWGVRSHAWNLDNDFAKTCLIGAIKQAQLSMELIPLYHELYNTKNVRKYGVQILKKIYQIRSSILKGLNEKDLNIDQLQVASCNTADLSLALSMIPEDNIDELTIKIYRNLLSQLIETSQRIENDRHARIDKDYKFQYSFARSFCRVALRLSENNLVSMTKPLIDSIDKCPELVLTFLSHFVYAEDALHTQQKFWIIWSMFSDAVEQRVEFTPKGPYFKHEARNMITTLLLANVSWKDGTKDWEPLDYENGFIKKAAQRFASCKVGLASLVRMLDTIGQRFLPEGIVWIEEAVGKSHDVELFAETNTIYHLESILRKTIYRNERGMRKDKVLQKATISLLNSLINEGSSVSFLLRESVVAPLPTNIAYKLNAA